MITKYMIDGISIRRWCLDNNYSYSLVYQAIRRGESIEKIKNRLNHYYGNQKNTAEEIIKHNAYMYKIATSYSDRAMVKREIYKKLRPLLSESKIDRVWDNITQGKIKGNRILTVWKDIGDHKGYQCSSDGKFRYLTKSGVYKLIHPYPKKTYKRDNSLKNVVMCVNIKGKAYIASRLIYKTFSRMNDSDVVLFKNGDNTDLRLSNLKVFRKREYGKLTGPKSRQQNIDLFDSSGNLLKKYQSIRMCASDLGVSYQTVIDFLKEKTRYGILHTRGLIVKYGDYYD